MPTRFNVSAPAQVGQTQLVVMTRQKSLAKLSDYIDDAAAALKEARICLRDVDIALQAGVLSNEVLTLAEQYFGVKKMAEGELEVIKSVLNLTSTGLCCDVTLKVGDNVGRNDADVEGMVMRHQTQDGKEPLKKTKPWHDEVLAMDETGSYRTGAIHIRGGRLEQKGFGTKTLLHEATHKYAGTADRYYFEDDGKTMIDLDGKALTSPITDELVGLINADSYAWFFCRLGRLL